MPKVEFKFLFRSLFGEVSRIDLDFDRPINLLNPEIVITCLIMYLLIGGQYEKEEYRLISGEPTEKDYERVEKLEQLRDTLGKTQENSNPEQMAILLEAIEDFFVVRRAAPIEAQSK